jgi:hypothetical protein
MNEQTLSKLRRLQDELRNVESLSPQDQQVVEHLQADLNNLLSTSSKVPPTQIHGLREQLEHAVRQFEASHPELTSILASTINELVTIGL